MLIAHVTDTHVVGPDPDDELFVDNNGRLDQAVAAINDETVTPDLVLLTGDLTNTGTAAEYEALSAGLAPLSIPVLAVPGNHDDRALTRATFPDLPWTEGNHASWVVDIDGLRIVGLDTTMPGEDGATFDDEREAWLRRVLAESDQRTTLAMHHPPFVTGIGWMDDAGFVGLDRFASVVADHPVERILCGHLHRSIQSTVAGIPAQVGISTVQHVDLDFAPDAAVALILDPVGYLLHWVTDDSWVTHTRFFDTGATPIHPAWAADM